ncbi:MAG: hypothetical protein HKN44_07285 [Ilumatobacter sp.]|nr:hypothetical protein [Ilumatobacter sp.]
MFGLAAVVGVVLAGCSKNAGISAEKVIVEELQENIGLGTLDPECGQPEAYVAGETFTCTAATEDGRVIEFFGEMSDADTFNIVTSNLLTAEDVDAVRAAAAEALGPEVGATIDPAAIVCPYEIILLDETGDFTCEITDASSGDVYALVVSTGGIEPGVGVRKLDFEITEQLR